MQPAPVLSCPSLSGTYSPAQQQHSYGYAHGTPHPAAQAMCPFSHPCPSSHELYPRARTHPSRSERTQHVRNVSITSAPSIMFCPAAPAPPSGRSASAAQAQRAACMHALHATHSAPEAQSAGRGLPHSAPLLHDRSIATLLSATSLSMSSPSPPGRGGRTTRQQPAQTICEATKALEQVDCARSLAGSLAVSAGAIAGDAVQAQSYEASAAVACGDGRSREQGQRAPGQGHGAAGSEVATHESAGVRPDCVGDPCVNVACPIRNQMQMLLHIMTFACSSRQ